MASLTDARDRLDEALWLSEAIFMATHALDEEAEQQAIRIVLDHLQSTLKEAKVTLAEIAGERPTSQEGCG